MKKSKTASYTLKLLLTVDKASEIALEKRFYIASRVYNIIINHCRKQYTKLLNDKEYQSCTSYKEKKDYYLKYGLTEYQLYAWIKPLSKKYKKFLDSKTMQNIAKQASTSVSFVLFKNGKEIQFKKSRAFNSIASNTNFNRLKFEDNILYFNTLKLKVRKKDLQNPLILDCLENDRIKYPILKREFFKGGYRYYVILVMEGHSPFINELPNVDDKVGIDIGPSTIAITSNKGCLLQTLISMKDLKKYQDKVEKIQVEMDSISRKYNPECYNEDGTPIKGKRPTCFPKYYNRLYFRLRDTYRRYSLFKKQHHSMLAKQVLSYGNTVFVEKINFNSWKNRSTKPTEYLENGKCKKKRRYGRSIQNRSPGLFLSLLELKLSYLGQSLKRVDTYKCKASQYNHVIDTYVKEDLSTRVKEIGKEKVQRDLYSSFLLMNVNEDLSSINKESCEKSFSRFIENERKCISKILNENEVEKLSSFGLEEYIA